MVLPRRVVRRLRLTRFFYPSTWIPVGAHRKLCVLGGASRDAPRFLRAPLVALPHHFLGRHDRLRLRPRPLGARLHGE